MKQTEVKFKFRFIIRTHIIAFKLFFHVSWNYNYGTNKQSIDHNDLISHLNEPKKGQNGPETRDQIPNSKAFE